MCTSPTHISPHLFPSKPFSWIQFVVEAEDTGTEWHSGDRINTAKQMFNKSPSSFQFCCSNQEFTTSMQIYAWHNPSCAQKNNSLIVHVTQQHHYVPKDRCFICLLHHLLVWHHLFRNIASYCQGPCKEDCHCHISAVHLLKTANQSHNVAFKEKWRPLWNFVFF